MQYSVPLDKSTLVIFKSTVIFFKIPGQTIQFKDLYGIITGFNYAMLGLSMNLQTRFNKSVAVLFLSGCIASSYATAGPKNVPFKATLTTTEYLGQDVKTCGAAPAGISTGVGQATYLGRVVMSGNDCVIPSDASYPPAYFLFAGTFTLRAANGDTLTAEYSGRFSQVNGLNYSLTNPLNGEVGIFKITGGTGQFIGAKGAGQLSGTQTVTMDPANQPSHGQFEATGVISY